MELKGCTRLGGWYYVYDAGTEVDGVRIGHTAKVCVTCGRVVVNAKIAGINLAFEFPIDSLEAVAAIVKSCRQSAQGGSAWKA